MIVPMKKLTLAALERDREPLLKALQSACAYCEYAQACQFEEGRGGDRSRYLYPVQSTRFWQELDREETEETK